MPMESQRAVEVYSWLSSALYGGWPAALLQENNPGTYFRAGWVDPAAGQGGL